MSGKTVVIKQFFGEPYAPAVRTVGSVKEGDVAVFADATGRVIEAGFAKADFLDEIAARVAALLGESLTERAAWFAGRFPVKGMDGFYSKVEVVEVEGRLMLGAPQTPSLPPWVEE